MLNQSVRVAALVGTGCLAIVGTTPFACAQSIGGFSVARGGIYAWETGTATTNARGAILANFPATSFASSDTLSPAFLSTLDVLIIGSATAGNSAIAPLSIAEQAALSSFVLSGGRAILITDNSTFNGSAPAANNSIAAPFGVTPDGTLNGGQTSTMLPGSNPFNDGPFGTVSTLFTGFPGWYSNSGPMTVLARHDANNQAAMLAAETGLYGPGSGRFVLVSDTGLIDNVQNQTLLLNTFDWVLVPSPTAASVLVLGGLVATRRRR